MSDSKPFIAREVPWQRGSRRRVLARFYYFHEAMRCAELVSTEGRCTIVELEGMQLAMWLNGKRLPEGTGTAPSSAL
jgi:hypothetical protein